MQLGKYAILDDQGDLVGTSDTLIGCCRQLARASAYDLSWADVQEILVDRGDGVKSVELFIAGTDKVSRFEIAPKSDVEPKEFNPIHNHMTRDIKPYGQCEGCNAIHNQHNEADC